MEKVAEVFQGLGARSGGNPRMTIGAGLLHCGSCDALLTGWHGTGTWTPGTPARYECVGCGAVSVSVGRVDRHLQRFTKQRLETKEFVRRWRVSRAAELDARIAEGHRIRAWCEDPANRKQVARVIATLPLGLGGGNDVAWALIHLAKQMTEQIAERAGLAGPAATGAARLDTLSRTCSRYLVAYYDSSYRGGRRNLAREFGGRRQAKEYVRGLESQLWELLAETRWRDAGPPKLPSREAAMEQDWAASSTTMVQRRHELVALALDGTHRALVDPDGGVRFVDEH